MPCSVDIPEQSGNQYNWMVNIPAGSKVEIMAEDSTGAEAWSGTVSRSGGLDERILLTSRVNRSLSRIARILPA